MSNRRERYLRREAERKARAAQQPVIPVDEPAQDLGEVTPDHHSTEIDADYAAYLASLDDDAEHTEFLDSLAPSPERVRDKEKITWHPNHQRGDNWHDYLICRCHECTSFRKVNGIFPWEESHPGEPHPWGGAES